MSRILIAGCGYIGEAAADQFYAHGWEVEGWTASAESAAKLSKRPYRARAVDVTNSTAVASAAAEFGVVVHCVSSRGGDEEQYRRLYLEGAKNLLAAFPGANFVFTSSTSVYPQTDGGLVDEKSPAEPPHAKGQILRQTEELIRAAGGIVLRLGGIHGPGRSALLTKFLRGEATTGAPDRFINHVHRDDVVNALLLLAQRREEHRGEIFNVVGDQPIKVDEAYDWLASRLKRPRAPFPSATWERGIGSRGESNKAVSNQKLRALGWTPRYPTFEAAMSESILPSFGF
jgi:nucleoside-diphosphate-sugar epimerase